MCNCNKRCNNTTFHRLVSAAVSNSTLVLTVDHDTNIADEEPFIFKGNLTVKIGNLITGAPIPVGININGATIPVWNKFGVQIQSNEVPKFARGYYAENDGTPHVILLTTPVTNDFLF